MKITSRDSLQTLGTRPPHLYTCGEEALAMAPRFRHVCVRFCSCGGAFLSSVRRAMTPQGVGDSMPETGGALAWRLGLERDRDAPPAKPTKGSRVFLCLPETRGGGKETP